MSDENIEKVDETTKKEKRVIRNDPDFIAKYVENVTVVSPIEIYWTTTDGSKPRRVCGAIKLDGKRCLDFAGTGTDHKGIGFCSLHEKNYIKCKKNWLALVSESAKTTTLGALIDASQDQEVKIGDVQEEIKLERALVLWFVNSVVNREPDYDKNGERIQAEFTKDDIKFLKELNIDMIKSKEAAARIKGSMKLDALTVRQFADQILTFLFGRLVKMVGRTEAYKLAYDMNNEVFAPMIASSMISGEMSPLRQIPDSLKDMQLIGDRLRDKEIE